MREISISAKKKNAVVNSIVHIMLTILSIIWLFPVFWVIMTSLRVENEGANSYTRYFFPKELGISNYIKLFTETELLNFPRMFMNTFIVAIFTCILSTIFVLAVSYSMSRLRFKMRKPFMNVALIMGLFPGFMSIIAVYFILKTLGLSEGGMIRVALVLVYSAGAGLGFYMAKGFFDTIPRSVDEAALIDGATKFQVFTKVTIPLSKPIIVYTILTSFMTPWLDFIFARVICRTQIEYYTVSIGLWSMLEREYVDKFFTRFAAGAVCVSVPIAVLFLVMQKFYQDGMSGAVKG